MKRRVWLAVAGLLLAGCQAGERAARWDTYQEPVAPQELPRAAGLSELKMLWRRDLGDGPEDGYALLQPAYSDGGGGDGGVVRDGAGGALYAASRSSVFKLAPADGAIQWRRDLESELGAAVFSGVGIAMAGAVAVDEGGVVAVALDDGRVIALDAASGETLWATPLGRQISAIPAVGISRVVARTADGLVAGLDAATGESVWSFERDMPALSIHGDSPPLISGDAVFTGLASGKLVANSVVTGREYWETEVSFASGRNELERLTDTDSAPLVSAATLFTATYQGHVAALRLQDAALQWKAEVSSRLPMALGGGRLLVTADLGAVVALDAGSGEVLWTQEGFRGHGMSRPLVVGAGARVVVGDAAGNLYALDATDGRLLEKRNLGGGAVVALAAGPGQFAVFSAGGRLSVWALDAAE